MKSPVVAALCLMASMSVGSAVEWKALTNQPDVPKVVAFNDRKTPPQAFPFLPERKKAAGFWTFFADPQVIAKLAQTATQAADTQAWENTGFWLHAQTASGWVSLPVYESADHTTGSVKQGDAYIALHQGFWKNLQQSRPADTVAPVAKPKTGDFKVKLGQRDGAAQSPDDRDANPFHDYEGDPSKESASVVVPPSYDGSEPYGLIVFITPGSLKGSWKGEVAKRKYIWVAPENVGNDQIADRRVWMAQQARAWALHHYRIDPSRMVISGASNGADAASATAITTPFGFNGALLFAPACEAAVGTVTVPKEVNKVVTFPKIAPLSAKGLSHIHKKWRFAYVVGAKDDFVKYCKKAIGLLEQQGADCKLYEIPNLGHDSPSDISEYLAYLDAPRGKGDAGSATSSATTAALNDVRNLLTTRNTAKARERFLQLWNNHPDCHTNAEVLSVIEKLEAAP